MPSKDDPPECKPPSPEYKPPTYKSPKTVLKFFINNVFTFGFTRQCKRLWQNISVGEYPIKQKYRYNATTLIKVH